MLIYFLLQGDKTRLSEPPPQCGPPAVPRSALQTARQVAANILERLKAGGDAYQAIAERDVFPAIIERQIPGLIGAYLMRAEDVVDDEVEFTADFVPRAYAVEPFDLALEVTGSKRIIEALAPPGKRVRVMQWSGDTTPFEAAVGATVAAGMRALYHGEIMAQPRGWWGAGGRPPLTCVICARAG